jgi:phage tail sheath gpL-like
MAISFERIPQGIRVPLFYVEISGRQASYYAQNQVSLLIGPMLDTGLAEPLKPVLVTAWDDAVGLFGAGSILADMVKTYRQNDTYGELWCIPHVDGALGKSSKDLKVTGPATAQGAIYGYIGGDRFVAQVPNGASPEDIVQIVADVVNADPFCLVTALPGSGADTDTLILTAKNGGPIGDEIDISVNLRGVAGGEVLPPGVSIETAFKTPGTGAPPIADLITAMGDDEYDFIGSPYNDTTSLNLFDDLMNDLTGRWSWDRQIYGGVFTAKQGTAQELVDFGRGSASAVPPTFGRNGPHVYCLGFAASPSPPWRRTAALLGQAASGLRADPARPLQTLPLIGVAAPPRGAGFKISDKNALLYSGISIESTDIGGQVRIARVISTYQKNAWGQEDPSWLDVQTAYTLMYVVRFLRQRLLTKFPRHKLADDGTPFGPGAAVATPSIIRGELVASYSEMVEQGMVENMEAFKQNLVVERNANDPNRVDILFPPDLINQLRVLALLVEFRLQYPAAVAGSVSAAA